MEWIWIIVLVLVSLGVFALTRASFIPVAEARRHLASGALVIDVRTPNEFRSDHISQALNIPLGELTQQIDRHVHDKNHVLLLHCQSGGRSGIAKQQLERMGYVNVHNLGSFSRARQVVSGPEA